MAIIDCQIEFTNNYFSNARINTFGELHFLGIASQVDNLSFGIIALSASFFNSVDTYSLAQINVASYFNQAEILYLILVNTFAYSSNAVVGWSSEVTFPKGINFQDYLSSHARFFGVNFRQDIDNIYIRKSDLPELSSTPNNTAQSLFVALLFRVLLYESNDLISLINVYRWNTFFVDINQLSKQLMVLIVEINIPAKHKYVDVEIINANTSLSPNEL